MGMGKAGSAGPWAIVHILPQRTVFRFRLQMAAVNESLKIPSNQCVIQYSQSRVASAPRQPSESHIRSHDFSI